MTSHDSNIQNEEKKDKSEEKHNKNHVKKATAEALDESQWHKHPGGG